MGSRPLGPASLPSKRTERSLRRLLSTAVRATRWSSRSSTGWHVRRGIYRS